MRFREFHNFREPVHLALQGLHFSLSHMVVKVYHLS